MTLNLKKPIDQVLLYRNYRELRNMLDNTKGMQSIKSKLRGFI